ncbi:MAG: hypothetical protein AAB855_00825 [Patescibacteria group bacterium]
MTAESHRTVIEHLEKGETEYSTAELIESALSQTYEDIENIYLPPALPDDINREIFKILEDAATAKRTFDRVVSRAGKELNETAPFNVFELAQRIITLDDKINDRTAADFDSRSGKIVVYNRDAAPEFMGGDLDYASILGFLDHFGVSPLFYTVHHEYIHSLQFDRPVAEAIKFYWRIISPTLLFLFSSAVIIKEVKELFLVPIIAHFVDTYTSVQQTTESRAAREMQAYIGSRRFDSASLTSYEEFEETLTRKSYKLGKGKKRLAQFAVLYDDMRRLYAMGCTDTEIGGLVKTARWDNKHQWFDTIEKRVQSRTKELSLTDADVDNLVSLDELRRMRYVKMIRKITREEIMRARLEQSPTPE